MEIGAIVGGGTIRRHYLAMSGDMRIDDDLAGGVGDFCRPTATRHKW